MRFSFVNYLNFIAILIFKLSYMIGFIVIVWYFGNTFEEGSDNFKFKFRFGMHFYAI